MNTAFVSELHGNNQLNRYEKKENESMENVQVDREMKKGLHRNQKGLTLVELLAVIVILGIITAIAIPSIGGLINKSKVEAHLSNAHMIIDAARMRLSLEGGGTQTVELAELVSDGYIEKEPTDPENKGEPYSTATVDIGTNATTGLYTYTITLVGDRDGKGTDITYLDGVLETDLKASEVN